MCEFQYNNFDHCGHRVIDTSYYCEKAKWRAGMTGRLTPCPEIVFNFHLTRANGVAAVLPDGFTEQIAATYTWTGVSGLCKSCTRQQKLPETTAFANNHIFSLSHFSSPAIVAQIVAQRKNAPRRGLATPEHPFVHMPTLLSSVFELLGIADQYSPKDQSTCKVLAFPAANFLFTQDTWTSVAFVNGIEINGVPNTYLFANCGLSPQDRSFIDNQVVRGLSIEDIYRMAYERRGIPNGRFVEAAQKGEIKPTAKTFSRIEELHEDGEVLARPVVNQTAIEQPLASVPKTPSRSRKASIVSAATAPLVSPQPRAAGVRKNSTPRKKPAATPRKVSVVENALKKTPAQYLPPPKADAAIDPFLLAQSDKKVDSVEAQEDAIQRYNALKMPPIKAKTLAASETLKSYGKRLLALSAAAKKSPRSAKMENAPVPNTAVEAQVPIANMLSPTPDTPNTSTGLGFEGSAYNGVASADATLSTPLKSSPSSNSSAETSPVDGVNAAKIRRQNVSEAGTPTKSFVKTNAGAAADMAAAVDDEMFVYPFHDNTLIWGMGTPYFGPTAFADAPSYYQPMDFPNFDNQPDQNESASVADANKDFLFNADVIALLNKELGRN